MNDIKSRIANLRTSDTYISLTNYYAKKSIFNIIGAERNEKVHSNFLAWLLNPSESHGLGIYPLQQLLLLLSTAKSFECNKEARLEEKYEHSFLVNSFIIHGADIKREYNTKSIVENKKGSLDIISLLDISIGNERKILPIVIENKVYSKENHYDIAKKKYMQTELYYEWGEKEYSQKEYFKPVYVFITIDNEKAIQKEYINISYQDIVDIILTPCLCKNLSEEGAIYLENYLRCLSYSDIETKAKRGYIMAITDNEKKLLKEFYETNKALLSAVADCLRNDDELDENEKASLSTFSKVINKDYTKYSFDGKSNLSKRRLVLEIVKKYVNDHRDITYEDFKKVFPDELHGTYCVCKKHEDIKKNQERNYFVDDLIELSDTKVAVCNQWGIDNVVKVIDKAKELEYEIVLDK